MKITSVLSATLALAGILGCGTNGSPPTPTPEPTPSAAASAATADPDLLVNPRLLRRFQTVNPSSFEIATTSPALVDLGQKLFFDTRLSAGGKIACASCHDLRAGGSDGLAASVGHERQVGDRNAPTVLNAAGAFALFWDGRSASVEEQALGPLLAPKEMANRSEGAVVARLAGVAGYRPLFKAAFPTDPEALTFVNVGRAIGAYERQLATPGRWDAFLAGDKNALTLKEKEGLRTFLNVGCMVCHTGPLLGGKTFERLGAVEPWPNQKDTGRTAVTQQAVDRMMFKVPTLRNVARTAPYFHDGSAATLPEAVRLMGKHQLGLELTPAEIESIVTWLGSLDGKVAEPLMTKPELPQ